MTTPNWSPAIFPPYMSLSLDENLSRKLAARLADVYPMSAHVVEFGLLGSRRPNPTRDAGQLRCEVVWITEFANDPELASSSRSLSEGETG